MQNLEEELLASLKDDLPIDFLEDVKDLLNNNEGTIGIENLATQLIEYEIKLNERQIFLLRNLARNHQVDKRYLEGLIIQHKLL